MPKRPTVYDVAQATKLEARYLTKGTHILRAFPSAGPNDDKGAADCTWRELRPAKSKSSVEELLA